MADGERRMEEGDEVLSMVVVFLTQEGNIGASRYYVMARDLTPMLLTVKQKINKHFGTRFCRHMHSP